MGRCVEFRIRGDWKALKKSLGQGNKRELEKLLERYGQIGVNALRQATPKKTGKTAASWSYRTEIHAQGAAIYWENDHAPQGVPVAILLQYGHGTRNGGYVQGVDYINPAMRPVFDELSRQLWKEVSR